MAVTTAIPERFVPSSAQGRLIEAEHLVRYRWAMRHATGRRVLDAGCGAGYGCAMLAAAGAEHVVGLDRAAAVLQEARPRVGEDVTLVEGEIEQLPFPSGSFGLVVCLETLEHLERPEAAIAELARVVAADGLVIVSSPNRDVYEPGNPHHLHEYTPTELRAALERVFPHVELRRQANLVASCVMPDDVAGAPDADLEQLQLGKLVAVRPGEETYTLAMASHVPLPIDRATTAVATDVTEVRHWAELFDEQQLTLQRQAARIRELEERERAVQAQRRTLLEAEQDRARVTALNEQLAVLRAEAQDLRERLERSSAVVASMQASPSWRLTAPLRALKNVKRTWRPRRAEA